MSTVGPDKRVCTRRVQRLGTSSLVVTLPKEWVRMVGLKPGDEVYVVIEGQSVHVIPKSVAAGLARSAEVDLSRLPKGISITRLISCAYVTGVDRLLIKGASWEAGLEARSVASRLTGVDVTSSGDGIEVRIVLDESRVNPLELTRNLARLGVDIIGLVERLVEEPSPSLAQLAREARGEIIKYEHLAVRMMTRSRGLGGGDAASYYMAGVVGDAVASVWELAQLAAAKAERGERLELDEEHRDMLQRLKAIFERIAGLRGEPSEAAEVAREAEQLRAEAQRRLIEKMDAVTAIIAEATKWLDVAASIIACKAILA